jgi:hypothetical protein
MQTSTNAFREEAEQTPHEAVYKLVLGENGPGKPYIPQVIVFGTLYVFDGEALGRDDRGIYICLLPRGRSPSIASRMHLSPSYSSHKRLPGGLSLGWLRSSRHGSSAPPFSAKRQASVHPSGDLRVL